MVAPALLVGAAVGAAALFGGSAVGIRRWRRRRMGERLSSEGERAVESIEKQTGKQISHADKQAEKDMEKTAGEKKAVKEHFSEKKEEQEILQAAGTEKAEEELEREAKAEEKIEEQTEKEEKEVVKDTKREDKKELGGKPKGLKKKEEKEEIKVEKEEAEQAEASEQIEAEIFMDLKDALALASSLEVIGKDTAVAAILEQKQEVASEKLIANINGLARQLGRYASIQQVNNYTLNWMRNYFWPAVFTDFERKIYIATYTQRLEEHLLPRVHAALDVAKASIARIDSSLSKIDGLLSKEYSDSKKAIKDINKLIKIKRKELKKVKKKARSAKASQAAHQLQKEINIMTSYLSRMESVQKKISETESFMKKNITRMKATLALLKAYSGKILYYEKNLERITRKVKKKLDSVQDIIHDSKSKIEELNASSDSAEAVAVEALKVTKKFFEEYSEILDFVMKFDTNLKSTVNAAFNMSYRERAIFFLLKSMETAQDGIIRGVGTIVAMSRAIIASSDVTKEDMNVFLKDLEESEALIQRGMRMADRLNDLAKHVLNQMTNARAALDRELQVLQSLKNAAQKEGETIIQMITYILKRMVRRIKQIDNAYISRFDQTTRQVSDFKKSAEQAAQARKLAA
ncbi:hypothetical protein D6764_03030 [Candidatus Woesearchaeota archaeon]|nr:MAG: hypothetical protein D6764_03030 [Candidatus Woesearchaeota archaeon]